MFNLKPSQRKLTKNEKAVLCSLIDDCKTPDIKIADKLKITTQAVGKIRKRLEQDKIITGYCAMLDFESVGVKVFALALLKVGCRTWKENPEKVISGIKDVPYIIQAFRMQRQDISLAILYGFKSMEEMESYFHQLQSVTEDTEIKDILVFSPSSIIKMSPHDLLKRVITRPDEIARPVMKN